MQDTKKQNEKDDSQTETEESHEQASIRQMLSGCTLADYLFTSLGIVVILFVAFCWPVFNIIFGKVVDIFVEFEHDHKNATIVASHEDFVGHFMAQVFFWSGLCLACGAWYVLGNFTTIFLFQMFALRRMRIIKKQYLTSILRQEIAWFDKQNAGEFASRISSDFKKFEAGINENLAMLIYHYTTTMISFATGIYYGWKLSLAVLAVVPLYSASTLIASKLQGRFSSKEMEANSEASSVAEEAISAIRTVFAFGGQEKEKNRYESKVRPAMKAGCKRNLISALESSASWASMYLGLAIGVFYGVKLMLDDGYSVGDVVIIYWSINFCGYSIGLASPHLESWKLARSAAAGIFKVIERQSAIDSSMEEGERLEDNFKTDIELRNVHFSYPTRSDVPILNGVNLKIKEGETVALVGASGCGKSTIIQLMQRFYDPNAGEVLLDGRNLKQLNPGWLRQQIGVVGQEPVLFDASIEENIRLGSAHMETVSQEDVERAAKEANAHEFISGLPEGYRTYVGDRGTQLSGGQKQRIAIARALISRPRVLLLDEATSALDLQSEHVVQAALDRASQGRTTIIVAHRLSTIINAHRIIVMDAGKVLEVGTHNELMARQSAYYNLVKAQEVTDTSNSNLEKQPKLDHLLEHNLTDTKIQRSKSKTLSVDDSETDSESESELKSLPSPSLRLLRLIWQDKVPFLIAFTCSIVYGMHTPIYALIFGGFVDSLTTSSDPAFLHSQGMFYGLLFVAQAGAVFLVNVFQISLFGLVGERLTMRLRMMAFGAIMKQEVAWFDKPENSAGALCSRLADDAANIQGATGLRVALMCQIVSGLICAVAIGFFFNWRMALMSLALMPIIAFASIVSNRLSSDQAEDDTKTAKLSSKILIEVINAMRTVVSMHKQQYFFGRFAQSVDRHYLTRKAKVMKKSLLLASTLAAPFFAYAGSFCYGGYLLANNYLNSGDFFRIAECCIISALIIGETAILSADYNKAKMAAYNIFKLIDQSPEKKAFAVVEATATAGRSQGNVSVRGLQFHYPSRPETAVLSGLSFSAQKGQTVALVGASGCGKSTTIQLLEQFYDYSGEISLDGKDVAKLDVDWVRRQLALVQQEPILFSYSIRENIAYGDNSREVPFEEIVRAAQMANVHEFVAKLPQGYETPVGGKGAQLSGGQKQRIAIARSLVRDPPVLLLDEATSALDTASEKVVQAALDEAAKGRTCLVIAHRLKTIVNAHKIVVLDGGRNVEEGTHEELLARKGHYWRLYNSAIAS